VELPAELEAAIRAAPDDRAGYLVAADWLSSQGDPQGELVALSLAPPSDEVGARIVRLQRELEPVDTSGEWNPVSIEWRWGFVVGVAISSLRAREEPELLRTILRAPVARFLRKLVLVDLASDRLVSALVDEPAALASLRTLILMAEDGDIEVAPVWRHAPALERLVMRVGHQVEPIALPRLRELSILGAHSALINHSELPRLETLRMRIPISGAPAIGDTALVRARLRKPAVAARFPALRRLTVAGADLGEPDAWRDIELVQQLELCDLMVLARGFQTQRQFVVDTSAPAPAALVMMSGTHSIPPGTLVALPEKPLFRVGRRGHLDLPLSHQTIAKGHAHLRNIGGRWEVRDLMSNNGTTVNGHRIDTCPLRSGDELAFGAVELRFVAGDIEAQAAELRARFGLSST
jgi:uncharacterized protein (TIGR02996 family)